MRKKYSQLIQRQASLEAPMDNSSRKLMVMYFLTPCALSLLIYFNAGSQFQNLTSLMELPSWIVNKLFASEATGCTCKN